MKKQHAAVLVLLLCLAFALLMTSCSGGPQNTNQAQNQPVNANVRQGSDSDRVSDDLPSDDKICEIANIEARIDKLNRKLKHKIENQSDKLRNQLEGVDYQGKHYPPSFNYKFFPYPNGNAPKYVFLYIAGTVHEREPFQQLAEFAEDFVRKGCTDQVFFVGRLPRSGEETELRDLGPFEWSSCEYPLLTCTDGQCRNPCKKFGWLTESNTSETKEESGTGTESRVNSDSNAGTNKGGNIH